MDGDTILGLIREMQRAQLAAYQAHETRKAAKQVFDDADQACRDAECAAGLSSERLWRSMQIFNYDPREDTREVTMENLLSPALTGV